MNPSEELKAVDEKIEKLHALLDVDDSQLKPSERKRKHNFDAELAELKEQRSSWLKLVQDVLKKNLTLTTGFEMDVDMPPFQPLEYKLEVPFFLEKESDYHIDILGRNNTISDINAIIHNRLNKDKYWPIIISSSRGMGKTFLLKKFGMQQVKDHLKSPLIGRAISYGRIISFDFVKHPNAIQSEDDVYSFFPRLMVFFICRIFNGRQVDGINFEEIKSFDEVSTASGHQPKFRQWLKNWQKTHGTERMIDEYIRLTNIAFGVLDDTPPVFLLDEIQKLCRPTTVESSFAQDGSSQMHTQLSLLLTQLAGKRKPICICTGTNSGKIITITKKSGILPQVLSLTPLVNEYHEFWQQLTIYSNQLALNSGFPPISTESDKNLIDALVYASYQIPRLLFIAHSIWYDLRRQGSVTNREFFIQAFEHQAIKYYDEMVQILKEFDTETIAHILFSCGVHWKVYDQNSYVPGTQVRWNTLIEKSLVFPYLDGCYIFPFSLVWRAASTPLTFNKKFEVEERCAELIPNLDVKDLFISFDTLCSWENYNFGVGYETMFVSSLAVKYYLHTISAGRKGYFPIPVIYDIKPSESGYIIMNQYKVNFSQGISLPQNEVFTSSTDLGHAIIHNKRIKTAHHDAILPAMKNLESVNIAVQAKASFYLSDSKDIMKQLMTSPKSLDRVKQLFWLYLGEKPREQMFNDVVFLDGSGCCNGLSLDFFILVKKLKSQNQK